MSFSKADIGILSRKHKWIKVPVVRKLDEIEGLAIPKIDCRLVSKIDICSRIYSTPKCDDW